MAFAQAVCPGGINELEVSFAALRREVADLTAEIERVRGQRQAQPSTQQVLELRATTDLQKLKVRQTPKDKLWRQG